MVDRGQSAGRRRVVVTGMGLATPIGLDVASTWRAVLENRSGIGKIRRFDPTGFPVTFAAEVPLPGEGATLKRALTELALAEAIAGLKLAGIGLPAGPRLGVCLGSEAARPPVRWMSEPPPPDPSLVADLAPDAPTRQVALTIGATGPRSTVSTACTSSSQALGEAMLRIRRGEVDVMVTGGVDVLSEPLMVVGFSRLGALSTRNEDPDRASRPFDRDRDGFVLGEGAGFLVLEEAEHARRRGAPILGEIAGYGCSCNAWRITDSPPDGRGPAQAMAAALRDAGLRPDEIGYVNAHGTSTQQNDLSESRAIRTVFGEHGVPVSSTKGHMGHLVAACGAVEAVLCLLALRDGVLPAGRNLDNLDPECPINAISGAPMERRVRYALTNAFGFGGSNGSVILGAAS